MSWLRPSNSSGSDRAPVGAFEVVVALDPHHRHALPGGGELVHRGGDGLFALGQAASAASHSALVDDRRTSDGHEQHLRGGDPAVLPGAAAERA